MAGAARADGSPRRRPHTADATRVRSTPRDADADVVVNLESRPGTAPQGRVATSSSRRDADGKPLRDADGKLLQPLGYPAPHPSSRVAPSAPPMPRDGERVNPAFGLPGGMRPDARAGDADARVLQLEQDNARLRAGLIAVRREQRNWPRCYPVVHLDLRRDIPADRRRAVRMGLTSWLFAALGYFVNWLVITVMFAADTDVDLTDWIIATAISAFGLPLGWLLWARSVYHANINDSFAEYAKFFVHGAFHIAWALWVIISPPCRVGTSTGGIWNYFRLDKEHGGTQTFLVVLNSINLAFWVLSVLFLLNTLQFVADAFRHSPHGRKQTSEGFLHLVGRMLAKMFSQGDVQLASAELEDVPMPVGTDARSRERTPAASAKLHDSAAPV